MLSDEGLLSTERAMADGGRVGAEHDALQQGFVTIVQIVCEYQTHP